MAAVIAAAIFATVILAAIHRYARRRRMTPREREDEKAKGQLW